MNNTVLLLFSKENDFQDQQGKRVQSLKLSYLPVDTRQLSPGEVGIAVVDGESVPFELRGQLREVPGYYDLGYRVQMGKNKYGRPTQELKVSSISFRGGAAQRVAELVASGAIPVGTGSTPGGNK